MDTGRVGGGGKCHSLDFQDKWTEFPFSDFEKKNAPISRKLKYLNTNKKKEIENFSSEGLFPPKSPVQDKFYLYFFFGCFKIISKGTVDFEDEHN